MKNGNDVNNKRKGDDFMSETIVNEMNFDTEVMESEKPVLLDFWAPWCGPCTMLAPVLEEVAKACPDIRVLKINVDEQPKLAAKFQVMSIPTLVFIKDGERKAVTVGVQPKEEILNMISL